MGFEISPGESAYSDAATGSIYFAPVNIGTDSDQKALMKYAALAVAAVLLFAYLKKGRK